MELFLTLSIFKLDKPSSADEIPEVNDLEHRAVGKQLSRRPLQHIVGVFAGETFGNLLPVFDHHHREDFILRHGMNRFVSVRAEENDGEASNQKRQNI